jgi:hypothetical protein
MKAIRARERANRVLGDGEGRGRRVRRRPRRSPVFQMRMEKGMKIERWKKRGEVAGGWTLRMAWHVCLVVYVIAVAGRTNVPEHKQETSW